MVLVVKIFFLITLLFVSRFSFAEVNWNLSFSSKPDDEFQNVEDLALGEDCKDSYVNWGSLLAVDLNGDKVKELIFAPRCGEENYDPIWGVGHQAFLVVMERQKDGRYTFANTKFFGENKIPLGKFSGHMMADQMIGADINGDGLLDLPIVTNRDNWNMDEREAYKAFYGSELPSRFMWASQHFVMLSQPDGKYEMRPVGSPTSGVFATPVSFLKNQLGEWMIWGDSQFYPEEYGGGPEVLKVESDGSLTDITAQYYEYKGTSELCEDVCINVSQIGPIVSDTVSPGLAPGQGGLPTPDHSGYVMVTPNKYPFIEEGAMPLIEYAQDNGANGYNSINLGPKYGIKEACDIAWDCRRVVIDLYGYQFFNPTSQIPKAFEVVPGQPLYVTMTEGNLFNPGIDLSTVDLTTLDVNCLEGSASYWYLNDRDYTKDECQAAPMISIGSWPVFPIVNKLVDGQILDVPLEENPFWDPNREWADIIHQFETERSYYFDINNDGFNDVTSFNINTSIIATYRSVEKSIITVFMNDQTGRLVQVYPDSEDLPYESGAVQYYADLNGDNYLDIVQYQQAEDPFGSGLKFKIYYGFLNTSKLSPALLAIDSDGDGLNNAIDNDDDGDGLKDDLDVFPLDSSEQVDTDLDGLGDNFEQLNNLNPFLSDSDGDGFSDKEEVDLETNPLAADKYPIQSLPITVFTLAIKRP